MHGIIRVSIRRGFWFLILILSVIPLTNLFAQIDTTWVRRYNGDADSIDIATDIEVDNAGNVIVTGYSIGSTSSYDIVTIKYDGNGNFQWLKQHNGIGNLEDMAWDMEIDSTANIYIIGSTYIGGGYSYDCILLKYNSSGVLQWSACYNADSNSADYGYRLAIKDNNIYVTGYSSISGSWDIVTLKYKSDGTFCWARIYNGPGNGEDFPFAIRSDHSGNVLVAGYSDGGSTSWDYIILKYDSLGTLLWEERYSGPGAQWDAALDMVVDSIGNIFVTGQSKGDTTNYDIVTLKYDSLGNLVWEQRYHNSDDRGRGIVLDSQGNILVTGWSGYDCVTFKYDANGNLLWDVFYTDARDVKDITVDTWDNIYIASSSAGDLLIAKYDPQGNLVWDAHYNGLGNGNDGANAIKVLYPVVYVTGYSQGSGTVDDYVTIKYSQEPGIEEDMQNRVKIEKLLQSFPNLCYSSTKIRYSLAKPCDVSLKIYNIAGQCVKTIVNGKQNSGIYEVNWDGKDNGDRKLPQGIYFIRMEASDYIATSKIVMLQ